MTKQELLTKKAKAEAYLKMATESNNVKRIVEYTEWLERINDKLATFNTTEDKTDLTVLKEFLESWKLQAKEFYTRVREEYVEKYKNREELFPTVKGNYSMSSYSQFINHMCDKYGKGNIVMIKERYSEIDTIIEKEAVVKEKAFISKVTKVVGNITDCRGLKIGVNGEINGVVIGDIAKANVDTIYAGGYNIQKLHYRVLVKKIK